MATATTMPTGPGLLLLGRPGAGKSALLQALLQATTEPSPAFKGRLTEIAAKGQASSTLAPVNAHHLRFEPHDLGGKAWSVTVLDTSGSAAQACLASPPGTGPLAAALQATDTIVLVTDAGAG